MTFVFRQMSITYYPGSEPDVMPDVARHFRISGKADAKIFSRALRARHSLKPRSGSGLDYSDIEANVQDIFLCHGRIRCQPTRACGGGPCLDARAAPMARRANFRQNFPAGGPKIFAARFARARRLSRNVVARDLPNVSSLPGVCGLPNVTENVG